jgi:hypothetical protein
MNLEQLVISSGGYSRNVLDPVDDGFVELIAGAPAPPVQDVLLQQELNDSEATAVLDKPRTKVQDKQGIIAGRGAGHREGDVETGTDDLRGAAGTHRRRRRGSGGRRRARRPSRH